MAFAQQVAKRVQETEVYLTAAGWTLLEGSTVLTNRTALKVFNAGTGGATRLLLKYMNSDGSAPTVSSKFASHYLGAGQWLVEPISTGLKLYGRAKLASGINRLRVFVTEYGE